MRRLRSEEYYYKASWRSFPGSFYGILTILCGKQTRYSHHRLSINVCNSSVVNIYVVFADLSETHWYSGFHLFLILWNTSFMWYSLRILWCSRFSFMLGGIVLVGLEPTSSHSIWCSVVRDKVLPRRNILWSVGVRVVLLFKYQLKMIRSEMPGVFLSCVGSWIAYLSWAYTMNKRRLHHQWVCAFRWLRLTEIKQ